MSDLQEFQMSASLISQPPPLLPRGARACTSITFKICGRVSTSPVRSVVKRINDKTMRIEQLKAGSYPESVLPGALEQLDHLERIPLLQDDCDFPPLSSSSSSISCTVTFELRK